MNEMIKDMSTKEKEPVGYPLSGHGGDERKDVAAESRDETRGGAEASELWIDNSTRDDQQMTSTLEIMKASLGVRKEPTMHEGDGLAKSDSSESVLERKNVLVARKPKRRYAQATLPLK
jgi:hypothetical protein